MAGKTDVTSASSLARSTALFRGNFSMIDIRPPTGLYPSSNGANAREILDNTRWPNHSAGSPSQMANSLRLLIRGERFAKLRRPSTGEDVAHLMDAHETSGRRDVDIGCCCMTVSYKQP